MRVARRTEPQNFFIFTLMRIYGGKGDPSASKKQAAADEPSIDVASLASRLQARFRDLRTNRFPVMEEAGVPGIEYSKRNKQFVVRLPRRTAVGTEDPFLFGTVMGLDLTSLPEGVTATASGTILTNEGAGEAIIRGRALEPNFLLRDALPDTVTELPATSPVMARLLGDEASASRAVARSHPASIAKAIEEAADECLQSLFVVRGLLQLKADESDEEEIEVTSKISAPATNAVNLTFHFSVGFVVGGSRDEMLLPPRELVLFPAKGHSGKLTLEEDASDPLEDRYPLSLVCQNYGSADSFIVGRGPQSILALVKEPGHVIRTSRSTDFLRSYHLVLSLVDKYLEPVRPKRPVDIFLSFILKPVVVAQGR